MAITYHAGRRIQGSTTDNSVNTSLSLSELKAYYKFNESSGNIINQATSIGSTDAIANSDLITSGVTYTSTGHVGDGVSFDGTNDDAKASSSTVADWNLFANTGANWSITCWMKTLNFTGGRRFLATGNGNAGDVILLCDHQNDGTIDITLGKISTDHFVHSTTDGWTDSAFHFVCLQYDDATGIFTSTIDGNTAETSSSHNLTNTDTSETYLYVGQNTAGQDYWNGVMDELSIWNRVLTADEISAIYNAGTGIILEDAKSSFISKPTNVQVGSRLEESDTRKMYHYVENTNKIIDGSYTVLKFTEDGTFTPTSAFNVEYLVVAGGGGGAGGYHSPGGGGGGAGGYLTATGFGVTAQSYSVTVGDGGTRGVSDSLNTANYVQAGNGGNSIFSTITSTGGGSGGCYNNIAGGNGGSGGGGSFGSNGGTGIGGQGYAGGNSNTSPDAQNGGGGGGSSGAGSLGSGTLNVMTGIGGIGSSSAITGSTTYYSGGGGAGQGYNNNSANATGRGAGGSGVGGDGGLNTSGDLDGLDGTINSGGGGGGGGGIISTDAVANGGAGGSGIVIIRFLTSGNTYSSSLANSWVEEGT